MIPVQAHIADLAAYALATSDTNVPPQYALAQNESLRPPSPRAIAAAQRAAGDGALYPDPECSAVRQELATLHDLDPQKIICGAGSLDLIGALARCYAGPNDAVLAPVHAYPFFKTAAQTVGARFDTAPEINLTASVDALLASVQADTRIVFLANPANPTGTRIDPHELHRLRDHLRPDILLVIDEAYGEFSDPLSQPLWPMVDRGNCVVLRTFSKAYGLAGLRVGWGVFPPTIADQIRKVMNPNGVSAPAQAAARAALDDQAYMRETCLLTADLRDATRAALIERGFSIPPSFTNFLLIPFESAQAAHSAEAALSAAGIALRPQSGAGLPHALRLTIGPQEAMDAVLSCLATWRKDQP